jgi:hypothetical protein
MPGPWCSRDPAVRSKSMPWFFPLMMLVADASRVIEIRLRMMALGQSTPGEMSDPERTASRDCSGF